MVEIMRDSLEERAKKAVISMADIVKDIDQKLNHMIEYKKEQYYYPPCSNYMP